jgi:hypothetical protein
MMDERTTVQAALFYEFSLEQHVPSDHPLRAIAESASADLGRAGLMRLRLWHRDQLGEFPEVLCGGCEGGTRNGRHWGHVIGADQALECV